MVVGVRMSKVEVRGDGWRAKILDYNLSKLLFMHADEKNRYKQVLDISVPDRFLLVRNSSLELDCLSPTPGLFCVQLLPFFDCSILSRARSPSLLLNNHVVY